MKNRKLESREAMVHIMEGDRVITIAGIRASHRNVKGDYNVRLGVAITSPDDEFEYETGFNKALGRANARGGMKCSVTDKVIMNEALLFIGQKISKRIKEDVRPFLAIPSYEIPSIFRRKV